jgi:hypothetical protein
MEVFYRVWRDEDKAMYSLSIADAWIAACASELGAILLHKDPEFKPLPIAQEWLPLKVMKTQEKAAPRLGYFNRQPMAPGQATPGQNGSHDRQPSEQ